MVPCPKPMYAGRFFTQAHALPCIPHSDAEAMRKKQALAAEKKAAEAAANANTASKDIKFK